MRYHGNCSKGVDQTVAVATVVVVVKKSVSPVLEIEARGRRNVLGELESER